MPKDRMPRPVPSMMYEQGQLKSKADMFTQRTIRPERVVTSVDSPSEALAVSIGEHGKVDLPYMAELLGTPGEYAQITDELSGVIFKDPNADPADPEAGWQMADEYLSGDVRTKLRTAQLAAETNPEFAVNAEALLKDPVDILTYTALKLSGFEENRVIGSGTVLDTARLKCQLGEHLSVDSQSVHAYIIGEHGDSEIAVWSSANVSGIPLDDFCEMRGHYNHDKSQENIAEKVKNSAYEIIAKKRATYYGVAMAVKRICEAIIRDEKSILPISSLMHGEFGIDDVVLSMPSIVGANGIETKVPISLSEDEEINLKKSADTLRSILDDCEI